MKSKFFLWLSKYKFDDAKCSIFINIFSSGSQESLAAAATAMLRESSVVQENPTTSTETLTKKEGETSFPEVFKFITWNIDGLDQKNLQIRTKAVTDYVKEY